MLAWNNRNNCKFTCNTRHWNRYINRYLSKLFVKNTRERNWYAVHLQKIHKHLLMSALCSWPAFGAFTLLANIWWIISNSKGRFNKRDDDAAVRVDGKPQNLRSFASCPETWKSERISDVHKLTPTGQTNFTLLRTLRCYAALIDDVLSIRQDVLTARFQSEPIERRFGQYSQMSSGLS